LGGATFAPTDRSTFGHITRVPVGAFRFIALDVETACRDAASICQIGLACVQYDNEIQTFSMLVNPQTHFDRFNIQLHRIGPEHVAGAARFPEVLDALFPLLSAHHLVQHNTFDKRAVAAVCVFHGIDVPELRWTDSVTIARRAWPELKGNGGHGLASLKRVLGLQFHHHDAGEDARAAAQVVLHAEARLEMNIEAMVVPARKKPATRRPDPDGPFTGAVAVFNGPMRMGRAKAGAAAAAMGMTVQVGLTGTTTHIVIADSQIGSVETARQRAVLRKAHQMRDAGQPMTILGETASKALIVRNLPDR